MYHMYMLKATHVCVETANVNTYDSAAKDHSNHVPQRQRLSQFAAAVDAHA